jgi:ribosomal-protein-alanine N-acetyltransferase
MKPLLNQEIVSRRLSLRPVGGEDVPALHSLWTDERVRRFLWDGNVIPVERTRDIVEKSGILFEKAGFGIWGVRARRAYELLGFAGYWHFRSPRTLELLFGVKATHWNQHIATEASQCVIRYGFEALHFETIDASTDSANAASARVLEKLGMILWRRALVDGLDTLFYTVNRGRFDDAS